MLLDAAIFHSNRYHAEATCEHCAGVIRAQTAVSIGPRAPLTL
jgi:hypothetical protein